MRQIFNRILIAFAGLSMLSIAPARAYEEDTHFTLTLVMCRAVGLTQKEALTVATYDQGMDDSKGTVANDGLQANEVEEHVWHAIPLKGTKEEVLNRKQELWDKVLAEKDASKRLQRLGVFFHYQQDTWAHRKHPNNSKDQFTPYSVPLGHAVDGSQPDRPPFDPVCALRCLEEGVDSVKMFMKLCLRRQFNPLFNKYNHRASIAEVDDKWRDVRKSEYFNTVSIYGSGLSPSMIFLKNLINAQVDAYTVSKNWNPKYFEKRMADEANYEEVRKRFVRVCARAEVSITLPKTRTPITTLTTAQLLK